MKFLFCSTIKFGFFRRKKKFEKDVDADVDFVPPGKIYFVFYVNFIVDIFSPKLQLVLYLKISNTLVITNLVIIHLDTFSEKSALSEVDLVGNNRFCII